MTSLKYIGLIGCALLVFLVVAASCYIATVSLDWLATMVSQEKLPSLTMLNLLRNEVVTVIVNGLPVLCLVVSIFLILKKKNKPAFATLALPLIPAILLMGVLIFDWKHIDLRFEEEPAPTDPYSETLQQNYDNYINSTKPKEN